MGDGDTDDEALGDGDGEADGETLGDGDAVADGVTLGVALGVDPGWASAPVAITALTTATTTNAPAAGIHTFGCNTVCFQPRSRAGSTGTSVSLMVAPEARLLEQT